MNEVDILENEILNKDPKLLEILLSDKSSKRNIIWATDTIKRFGNGYSETDEITLDAISGNNGEVLRPRVSKSKAEQTYRSKEKAEVFTPAFICNKQNNLIDKDWFNEDNVFNKEIGNDWIPTEDPINFPTIDGKTWTDYVSDLRLEITCGEAPYLVSRYDAISGNPIPLGKRIGLLDRKIRVVCENTDTKEQWLEWVFNAYKSTYAYEWQGDNLLLARENLLFTFIDYYQDRFHQYPDKTITRQIANIIAWNIWQMDGLKGVIPYSCKDEIITEKTLFGDIETTIRPCEGCKNKEFKNHNGIYCKIKNWKTGGSILYVSLINNRSIL